jgi:hypothetical protein
MGHAPHDKDLAPLIAERFGRVGDHLFMLAAILGRAVQTLCTARLAAAAQGLWARHA